MSLFNQIDENVLHHSLIIRYFTPVLSRRWSDPCLPVQMDDLLTSGAIKSIIRPSIKDLSPIGIEEVTKPIGQGFTAFIPAGPALEGVVSLSYTQQGNCTVVEVHRSIELEVYICDIRQCYVSERCTLLYSAQKQIFKDKIFVVMVPAMHCICYELEV